MQYTCDKKTCPCGARCSNVPLGERQSVPEGKEGLRVVWVRRSLASSLFTPADLLLLQTGDRGFGLKTMVPLYAGQFVMEYRGEVRRFGFRSCARAELTTLRLQIISRDESYKRVLTTYKGAKSYYFLDYDGHEVIDAVRRSLSILLSRTSC